MPIYEYDCADCKRKVSIFFTSIRLAREATPQCPRCKGKKLTRRASRVSMVRSEESRVDSLADESAFAGLDENDPKSLAQFMRKMANETGETMDPEFDEVCSRLESGEDPESIESSLGEGEGGGGAGGGDAAGGAAPCGCGGGGDDE